MVKKLCLARKCYIRVSNYLIYQARHVHWKRHHRGAVSPQSRRDHWLVHLWGPLPAGAHLPAQAGPCSLWFLPSHSWAVRFSVPHRGRSSSPSPSAKAKQSRNGARLWEHACGSPWAASSLSSLIWCRTSMAIPFHPHLTERPAPAASTQLPWGYRRPQRLLQGTLASPAISKGPTRSLDSVHLIPAEGHGRRPGELLQPSLQTLV